MQLSEKLTMLRKQNNLTQEQFAEEMSVSRQTVSKWERGDSVPDIKLLAQIADFYELSLDQLARDEYGISPTDGWKAVEGNTDERSQKFERFVGKICDISMNSFMFGVIRNAEIIGVTKDMICFIKNKKLGFVNLNKVVGILSKKEGNITFRNTEFVTGKCKIYTNAGTYFGGNTYLFSEITEILENGFKVKTGEFVSMVSLEEMSVILMKEKLEII